jgi:hypothetical protein
MPRIISALYTTMTSQDRFISLAQASFPIRPVPTEFFWVDAKNTHLEIPQKAQRYLRDRSWPEVTVEDWTLILTTPAVARAYMDPKVYLYYLPSLLAGIFNNMGWIEYVIDGILPFNREHYPKGKWWKEFDGNVSPKQRRTIQEFIRIMHKDYLDLLGDDLRAYLFDASEVWDAGI